MYQSILPVIAPLRLHLETLTSFRVPEYKGALFRGGFGQFFRDLVCITRKPVCTGCPHLAECPYSTIFESPVLPEKIPVLRKYPNAPHPFVMVPPLDPRTSMPAGSEMALDLTLIGPGLGALPHFIMGFEQMGASGRYGGRFRLKSVRSALEGSALIFDGLTRRVASTIPTWNYEPEPLLVRRMDFSFLTPLRMRTEGRYNNTPDFVAVAHALLRRVHLLAAIYGRGDGDAGWMKPLLARADEIQTQAKEFTQYAWDRMSGRQHRRVDMDGVIGKLTASGDLADFAPLVRFGEWVNVGSGTSMGLGRYRAEFS